MSNFPGRATSDINKSMVSMLSKIKKPTASRPTSSRLASFKSQMNLASKWLNTLLSYSRHFENLGGQGAKLWRARECVLRVRRIRQNLPKGPENSRRGKFFNSNIRLGRLQFSPEVRSDQRSKGTRCQRSPLAQQQLCGLGASWVRKSLHLSATRGHCPRLWLPCGLRQSETRDGDAGRTNY